MVTIHHSPVSEAHFPHQAQITQELQAYERILYRILSITSSDLCALQDSIFHDAMETHQLYFFYVENTPQPLDAVRSIKLRLYIELQSGQLQPAEVWEEELNTSEGYSQTFAAIQGTRDNVPYLVERHQRVPYDFGCILPHETDFSPDVVFKALPDFLRPQSRLTRVDFPKLLRYFSALQAHLFQLPFDAQDKLQFVLFAHRQDAVFAKILAAIDEEFALPERN